MTFEILAVFALILVAFFVFILEIVAIDFVAFAIMAVVLLLGPIWNVSPSEAILGFSNPATITILAMFILAGGIARTGAINWLAQRISYVSNGSEIRQILIIIVLVAPLSAFINNTPIVAIMIPLVIRMAIHHGLPASKLLIPLSYIAQLAGVVTLVGTSTNIVASGLAEQAGIGSFGMFDFASIGLLVFSTGALYLLFIGRKLLPDRQTKDKIDAYHLANYITEVAVLPDSHLIGKTLLESDLGKQLDLQVLDIRRGGEKLDVSVGDHILQAYDVLLILAKRDELLKIKEQKGLELANENSSEISDSPASDLKILEVVIGPNSDLAHETLESSNFRSQYNCNVLAIKTHGSLMQQRLSKIRLGFGDTLLLQGKSGSLDQFKLDPKFIVTEELKLEKYRTDKIPIALGIMAVVVLTSALGIVPILVSSIVGSALMVITGCLNVREMHESIHWDVIFLLVGVIPLGLALERSGGAQLLADLAIQSALNFPPIIILGIFYLASMGLTALISNNATVVILIPIGIATAQSLGFDPKAFVLAIMFAASNDFATPIGYQTNTMVYGPGGYKFLDYTKVGGGLNLLLAILTPIFIYFLWGLN